MAITKLRKLQLGRESTAGTPVAATTIYRAPASSIVADQERVIPDENVGYLGPIDRGYFPSIGATYEMPESEATFEQILHLLEAGVQTVSATANGGTTTAYVYTYAMPTTAQNTIKTYTLEVGNDQQAYRMGYGHVETITLSGVPREAVKVSAMWRGQSKMANAFTGALSLAAVEEILFGKGKLYLDDAGGTLGGTLTSATWMGFTMEVNTGWRAQWTGDGALNFSFIKNIGPDITGSLTLEYNATGVGAETAFAAGTTKLVRMDFDGSTLSGSGGTYSTKKYRVDLAMQITSVDPLESRDGNDIVTVNFRAVYNATAALYANFLVCNLLATVP